MKLKLKCGNWGCRNLGTREVGEVGRLGQVTVRTVKVVGDWGLGRSRMRDIEYWGHGKLGMQEIGDVGNLE